MKASQKKNEKEFVIANSLLTDLCENKHIRTVYNGFVVMFLSLFIYSIAYDYLQKNEFNFGLKTIKIAFGKFHIVILGWGTFFMLTCLVHFLFKLWTTCRKWNAKILDSSCLMLLFLYYIFSFKLAEVIIAKWQLPIASSYIISAEQCRFSMKIHSFIRTNSCKSPKNQPVCPNFSNFLYFLFAPTLLYRDSYPRTPRIDWFFALMRLLETVGVIFFLSFVTERLLQPPLEAFCLRKYTLGEIILICLQNIGTGALLFLALFFVVLHTTQNFFAEVLRFGDRVFYRDWWTATEYATYMRKWNIIVQDWLYNYIYLDFRNFLKMGKTQATLSIFVISAVVHEWLLTFGFGFFFPLLFFEFVFFGIPFTKVQFPSFNILFLYSVMFGMSLLTTFYTIEYYARNNAPIENPTLWELTVPRFITGDCIEYK